MFVRCIARGGTRAILIGWLVALAGFASFFTAAITPNDLVAVPIIFGFVLIFAGIIGGMLGARILVPARIDKHFIWLTKVSPIYLATFPEVNFR